MSYNPLDPKDLINPTKLENYINPLSPYGPKGFLSNDDDDDDDDCSVENGIGVFVLALITLITLLILPMLIMIATS